MTKATETVADARQRQQIREAMGRLIDGTALHSDGKLTIKSLAEEAQVKRWILTHRHTDLQAEFRARITDTTGSQPPAIRKLQDAQAQAEDTIRTLRAEVADIKATLRQYERVVQVLALENHELQNESARNRDATLSIVSTATTRHRRHPPTSRSPQKPCS